MLQRFLNERDKARKLVFDVSALLLDLIGNTLGCLEIHHDGKGYDNGRKQREDEEHRNGKDADEHRLDDAVCNVHLGRHVHTRRAKVDFKLHSLEFVDAESFGDPHGKVAEPDIQRTRLLFLSLGEVVYRLGGLEERHTEVVRENEKKSDSKDRADKCL